jgi:hypothetical protein
VTRDEAIAITGQADDHHLVEILTLQPLPGELLEAISGAGGGDLLGAAPAGPHATQLCAILEAADIATADTLELEEQH